jgi:TM2 domain-containing membrane protein YozV
MKGTLLDFSVQQNSGLIAADDGARYSFAGTDWNATQLPTPGQRLDFEVNNGLATRVYPDLTSTQAPPMPPMLPIHAQPQKTDRTTAGLLAILLGALGIHKFMMGYQQQGIIMIAVSLGAGIVTCGIASVVIHIIAIVEGIIYFSMSDEEFDRTYITGRKSWF